MGGIGLFLIVSVLIEWVDQSSYNEATISRSTTFTFKRND